MFDKLVVKYYNQNMELKDYEMPLKTACDYAGIVLTDEMTRQFERYYELLVEWNEKINLTAITEQKDVYLKHFADSVFGARYIKQNATLCDIGTGAGFPALVLKIVRPDINLTLVDALEKRIKFLNIVVEELGLKGVQTLHFRAEDKVFKDKFLNGFDCVTARAVAKMNTLSEYCLPFVKIGGHFLAYKSDKIQDELDDSKKAILTLGGGKIDIKTYNLDEETTRTIVDISKIKNTDKKYPRDKNKPKLQPIC